MRYLLTILFFFIAYVVNAQYIPNSAAYQYKGLKQTNSLQPPTGAAFPVTATNAPDSNYAAWFYNTLDTSFYQFNPIPKTWTKLQSNGGLQIDSVFITSIDSIYITNTDSIFIITNNNDTIFIGSGNPAVDTIYQRGPDSIFAVKSGVEFLAAVTGASAPSGGMDTAYTRSDSILGVKNNGEFLISEVQANIDSIFITNSDSIFIITGNDTVFIGQANAMDTAYQRGDSIFGVKGGIEFFITLTGNSSISLLPLSPGYGIIGSDYNGTSPQTWAIDTSILNGNIFIDSSTTEFFVDTISNSPPVGAVNGATVLVGTSPTGAFTGHANEVATLIGAIWSFEIPEAGDNLVLSNDTQPTSFYQYTGTEWVLRKRAASIGGDNIGVARYDLGNLGNGGTGFLTRGIRRELISNTGFHYFYNYRGANTNNYLKIDSATGRLDTASFTPLVLTTNGSAGPAELVNDTLNIPIYTGAGPHNDTLYFNVEWFGAVHDSVTDDGPAIQAGVDYIHNYAPGAILFFPAGNYRDTSHVHWRSKVNALGEGEASNIFNDLPTHTRFGDQAPIFFGNLTPASWDSTDLRYFSASYANANKVKVVDSISRFAVGDIVIMRGATFWLNTDGQVRPHVVRENRVVAIDGDTLFLEEPLDTVITKIAISGHYITGSGKRLDAYGELAQFISDCSINNLKLTSVYGDVALGIAMFKCNFNNVWTYGKESLGGNGESFCSFNNIYATFSKQAWENSIGTHNTTVNFLRANWNGIEDAENKPVVKFGESVYAVDFTNLHINANGFDGKGIWFGAATHCSVNGFRIKGEGMNDNLIEFSNSNNVISNIVRNGKLFSSTSSHYVEMEKNAGVNARLEDNIIEHIEAYGNTGANGVVIDGRNTVIKDSYFEDGNLSFGDSLVNYKIDNTTINGSYYLSKSNISTPGIIDVTGGLKLTTSAGTPGTDSVLVQSGGIVKRISPTYYGTGSGSGGGIGAVYAGTGLTKDNDSTLSLTIPVTVARGGTGVTSTTAYGVLTGGTTSTGAFQNTGTGTSGQFLRSNGSSALPTWQTVPVLDTSYAYRWTSATGHTWLINSLGTTVQEGVTLADTTTATNGSPHNSPAFYQYGTALNSTSGLSQTFGYKSYVVPSQAAGNIGGTLTWSTFRNGASVTPSLMTLTQAGTLTTATFFASTSVVTPVVQSNGANTTLTVGNAAASGSGGTSNRMVSMATGTVSQTNGDYVGVSINPVYNIASGSAPTTAFRIQPVETALSSGAQYFMEAGTRANSGITSAFTQKFAITNAGKIILDATITAGGTTGNQTINKPSGTVNIAAAGTNVVVTNSLVTTSSLVRAWVRTNDANKTAVYAVVPAAGSFTIYVTPVSAAEISIGFEVIN